MSSHASIRRWYAIHKWTSLICTAFMLLLCITGLPLIFHHEIHELEHHLAGEAERGPRAPGTELVSLDATIANALKEHPGHIPGLVSWVEDEPDVLLIGTQERGNLDPQKVAFMNMDQRNGAIMEKHTDDLDFMDVMFRLHVDLFAGLPGMLFLGVMGMLLLVAIISGIVVYGPFMRKLEFGTVRESQRRLKWLDLHNLLGVVTLSWFLVVGSTGVINTWATLLIKLWQFNELGTLIEPYKKLPEPLQFTSLDAAVEKAKAVEPDMTPTFVFYPGYFLTENKHHIAVLMKGNTPVTSRLLKPVLIDAQSGEFTASVELPWYLKTLLLSQPLHFGDYAGLPLKILWALLDIISIIVLGSGLYLWFARRRLQDERIKRIAEKAAALEKAEGAAA
ncbi:MAG: PepSY-associated TM helix domain-containing protein [Pedobacter sp.]|nr:PepSY-associated TM helix domain-containing protein [Pedobacter sp.]